MIYTSYFAKLPQILKQNPNAIYYGITRYPPKWYKGSNLYDFAPTPHILSAWKKNHNQEDYITEFNKMILAKLSPEKVKKFFSAINGDVYLLCFERSSDFCHRHLLAQWLNSIGLSCQEWSST